MQYHYVEVKVQTILNQLELLKEYSQESKSPFVPEINPSTAVYQALEDGGALTSIAVVKEDQMVGFIVMVTTVMPHYSELGSVVESLFIHKDHRKFGTGKALIEKAREIAKLKGAKTMFLSAPEGSRLDKATSLLGFVPTHRTYMKVL